MCHQQTKKHNVCVISKQRKIIYVSVNFQRKIIYVCVVYYHSTVPKLSYIGFINGLETLTIKTCQLLC